MQSSTSAAPVVADVPVHWRVKTVTAEPGDFESSANAIVAAPFVGSRSTWKKSSSVRSRAGTDVLQLRPSMQIDPVWITWSDARAATHDAPPSTDRAVPYLVVVPGHDRRAMRA